jgi:hypothetical protein
VRRRSRRRHRAPQRANHGARFSQPRRDVPPHQMRLGKAVEQQHRRARASATNENGCVLGSDLLFRKRFQYPSPLLPRPSQQTLRGRSSQRIVPADRPSGEVAISERYGQAARLSDADHRHRRGYLRFQIADA